MNTLVCLKRVLDPDLPARDFKIDPEAKEAERGSANLLCAELGRERLASRCRL